MAASDKEYNDFKEQFEAMQIDSSRLRLLKAWLSDHQLTCEQAVGILQLMFGLGDVAIKALAAMHPRLTDPENVQGVLIEDGFQYDDERADARAQLGL
mmetsp:Transcript_5106/g.13267  ORF Transcript_5106/g.13267 Transcript_5106/m.13267 type:complete len:98 (-) Transcript_5106:88-381(-)|eukprot:CAMPEP_0182928180 /NCGR_PEP_ID=MMETSP0105_2-20130417/15439_1 /TAXON_ID=81532 ORGANISM="Acanthoeca-like sp., Strain 10tr" /NCGR_SAMPLE_ID=MMETSP0105_2 /ASSEMBLY_ACC=CAM_ASM_000205 /LENGTH=97 /DNA_ID=CAMNT_0025066179 /DNA_START=88 /DNA_END=381 /DNA_ORIENTATION=-